MKMTNKKFKEGLDTLMEYAFDPDDCWLSDDDGGIPETRLVGNRETDPQDPEHSEILIFANGQRFQINWKELEPITSTAAESLSWPGEPLVDADMDDSGWSYSLYRETGEGYC